MKINGDEVSLSGSGAADLRALIEGLGLDPNGVAVEYNGTLPERETWDRISLNETDVIEIIRFVGGG